ncbi:MULTISPECIES: hypothetical protein [unclassified Deinococcus]|uniref:hypothetical protein n=1 Tax=unclassified Deinococcus TaxID=2623546 RepID=UPI001C2FBB79|nr:MULTISPECIES: hypothetical protein [unclassified Deinococcus]MDK2014346.1 hypothetical protein [Deinococcus sp. 43]
MRHLHLLNLDLEVELPAPLHAHLHTLFARPPLTSPRHTARLTHRHGRPAHRHPGRLLHTHTGAVWTAATSDTELWIYGTHQDVHLTLTTQPHIEVWSEHTTPDDPLPLALLELLRSTGLLPLRAAASAVPGGATALLGEPSGRTTTLVSEIISGARPICNDLALYQPSTGHLIGLDSGLHCPPDTLARLQAHVPTLRGLPASTGHTFVPWTTLTTPADTHALLVAACVVRPGDQRPPGEYDLPASRRLMALWAAAELPLRPASHTWTMAVLSRLASQLIWSELVLPPEPPCHPPDHEPQRRRPTQDTP